MSGGGGGKKGGAPATYTADVILGLGEGVITAVTTVYRNQKTTTLANIGLTLATGEVGQAVWGYLESTYPNEALAYSGEAYLHAEAFGLGTSGTLPSDGFEVIANLAGTACDGADPSQVVEFIASNPQCGSGFPATTIGTPVQAQELFTVPSTSSVTVSKASAFMRNLSVSIGGSPLQCVASSPASGQFSFTDAGEYTFSPAQTGLTATINYSWRDGLTDFQAFTLASGLWISPSYDSQAQASAVLGDIAKYCYSEIVWRSGLLGFVPRSAVAVDGTLAASFCIDNPGSLTNLVMTWGPDRGADITLSDSNLTATGGGGTFETVLSSITLPPGDWYMEFPIPASVTGAVEIGLYGSAIGPFNPPYPDIASLIFNNGFGYISGTGTGGGTVGKNITGPAGWPTGGSFGYTQIDTFVPGDTVGLAIRVASDNTYKLWLRVIHNGVAKAWNDSDDVGLPSDPVAGTGYFSGGAIGVPNYVAASLDTASSTSAIVTANFGPLFAATPPTGFTTINQFFQYSPPPVQFDLGVDDFLPNAAGSATAASTSDDPVIITRKRAADQINTVQLEFLDGTNQYAASIAEASDQALIDKYTRRFSGSQQAHLFTTALAANLSARLLLQKEYVRRIFSFVLDERYIVLDPMDIVTLTEPDVYLDHVPVRITEMTEQDDGSIAFLAEEIPEGIGGGGALRSFGGGTGYQPNTGVDPGVVNPPIIFVQPTLLTGGALSIAMALSGSNPTWGGCDVYASETGAGGPYAFLGKQLGSATMGVTTTAFPPDGDPDTTDSLGVDLTESEGEITSFSPSSADAFRTLAYVGYGVDGAGGELIAYTTATLTATSKYTLSGYTRRGAYGTPNGAHLSGADFALIDSQIFATPYALSDIGKIVFFKFPSFNIFGDAPQSLADCIAYPFLIGSIPPMVITASENLAAGALVNIWDNSGVANARNANATDATKPADGFVLSAVTSGNPAAVFSFDGAVITGLTGLTQGATYYLDTSGAGGVTAAPPSASGNLVQKAGKAIAPTMLLFAPYPGVTNP